MTRLTVFAAAVLVAASAHAYPFSRPLLGTEDVPTGVLCKINDVTVLAATAEDCTKIGGEATHQVTSTRTPLK